MKRSFRVGFTLVELLVVIAIIGTLVGMLLPAVQNAREAGRSNNCRANLTQLQKAMTQYEMTNGEFPGYVNPAGPMSQQVKATWGAMMLPFIEQQTLWDEKYARGSMGVAHLEIFDCPSNPPGYENAPTTSYVANAGWFQDERINEEDDKCEMVENPANGVFFDRTRGMGGADARDLTPPCDKPQLDPIPIVKFASIQAKGDGSTNVLEFAECINGVAWTYTNGLPPDKKWHFGFCWEQPQTILKAEEGSKDPPEFDNGHRMINRLKENYEYSDVAAKSPNMGLPSSFHPGGVNVAFVGGQVIFLRDRIDPFVYAQLMTSDHKRSDLRLNPDTHERQIAQPDADDY